MQRRAFLKTSVAGLAALAFAPSFFASPSYVLYGDGVHDDTEALQAWIEGKSVYFADGKRLDRQRLSGGRFQTTQRLVARNPRPIHIDKCEFACSTDDVFLEVNSESRAALSLTNVTIYQEFPNAQWAHFEAGRFVSMRG